jgi:hypothetical protein
MEHSRSRAQRRDALKILTLAVASVALGPRARQVLAQSVRRVDEQDPAALGLGYRHDAANVDRKKFVRYQEGQTCSNCRLYQGKDGAEWGACPIFAGKLVAATGWCNAYVKSV